MPGRYRYPPNTIIYYSGFLPKINYNHVWRGKYSAIGVAVSQKQSEPKGKKSKVTNDYKINNLKNKNKRAIIITKRKNEGYITRVMAEKLS